MKVDMVSKVSSQSSLGNPWIFDFRTLSARIVICVTNNLLYVARSRTSWVRMENSCRCRERILAD